MIFGLIFLLLLVQLVSASQTRKKIPKGSEEILLSKNCPQSISSLDVDFFNPVVDGNGKYNETVVVTVAGIVEQYLELRAVQKYQTSPASESFFTGAFKDVLNYITVNLSVVVPDVFENLIKSYTTMAYKYNCSISTSGANSVAEDVKTRADKAIMCIILVQEAAANDIKFTQSQIPILLEFIYRFGTYSSRYELAFQSLYSSVEIDLMVSVYTMFVDNFDPSRMTLHVFYILTSRLKDNFVDYMLKLSSKVMLIDSVANAADFNRHASMCITSMISCYFIDEFIPRITELLPLVDMVVLGSSPRFSLCSIVWCKNSKDEPASPFLELISSHLIEDNLILSLERRNYIYHGSIIHSIEQNQPALYEQHTQSLSIEALNRLHEIQSVVIDYETKVECCAIFQNLELNFSEMENENFNLDMLRSALFQIIPFMPVYFEYNSFEADKIVSNLVATIPKLVHISLRKEDNSLDIKRFGVLTQLLEVTFTGSAILAATPQALASILFFFTSRLDHVPSVEDVILRDAHIRCVNLSEKLVQSNLFFKSLSHRALLYKYLKIIAPERADRTMINCFFTLLSISEQKYTACLDIINTAYKLKLNSNSVFSNFLENEIRIYLKDFTHIPIEYYQRGTFSKCAELITEQKLLSKTEQNLLKKIFSRFSSNQNS